PLEIFRRLIVGSEGTLAFLAEAVFDTVPLGRHTALGLFFFEDIDAAVEAVQPLVAAGATATELMVAPTLIAAEAEVDLDGPEAAAQEILSARELLDPPRFSREREEIEMLWHVREGMQ